MTTWNRIGIFLAGVSAASLASAAIIPFDLQGKAGFGLLAGNENHVVSGAFGSGGETGAGIFFDDVSNVLTLNFGWGTANGFTNLTGNATVGHIHGPTASGGVASFTQNAGIAIGLDTLSGWSNLASSGGFSGNLNLTLTQASQLLAGQLYINIHTSANGPGEIRGNLVAVPEPSAWAAILGAIVLGYAYLRRRKA
jgi:hypothetical protein